MSGATAFKTVLEKFRMFAFSERDKGERFERLMQAYLQTDPKYAYRFKKVWLWNEFPGKLDLGISDTGIDLVALTNEGDYWAIQCKCYQESSVIDKPAVDSFLSTSSRQFKNEDFKTTSFSQRLWISTTNKWGPNATEAIKNQSPPVARINLYDLIEAPVDWEKLELGISGEQSRIGDRDLKPHQKEALEKTHTHFKTQSRGKLIMACGTGKTFNSLRIAEKETDGKGLVLFLVPSIALLGQTLREWTTYSKLPINAVCICSDPEISRKRTKHDDSDSFSVVDLALPASTNVNDIIKQFKQFEFSSNDGMTVVFSTYQSIEVIAKAQQALRKEIPKLDEFDLVICDEAHRTTGVSLAGEDESSFTKVHDNNFLKAKKRLYMTATPRLYSDDIKSKAAQAEAILCSMDDESLYGKEIYRIGFGEAVDKDLLTDYKVLILTLSDTDVPPVVQRMIADKESEINTDDASKLIGCINALSKQILGDEGIIKDSDPAPMRRAVAFCSSIDSSRKITSVFNTVTDSYIDSLPQEKREQMVAVGSKHVDGTMSAPYRDELLGWLKSDTDENECRILTNVRCLSEGVDVPSLDAVLFLSARNSQVDVVQSVGRVMRKAPGKKYGYIIIPVVVPSTVDAATALDDNERYKVVWTVLNALRAHDDRFNATVNKIELNKYRPDNILVGRPVYAFDYDGRPTQVNNDDGLESATKDVSRQLALQFEQLQNVVFARMVTKVGDRRYWEQWAKNVAEIAERQVIRISGLIKDNGKHQQAFANFLGGLQKNINPSITEQEAVEMLSQHIITKPVFEALFEGYSFVKNNPISVSMQQMLDLLEDQALDKDAETLYKFYESVKMRASGIDNAEGKQRIIIELYDKFFKTAFPKMVEKLGIVYTPVEVVDFIIHSVDNVLKQEFGRSISDENIHILDPFTGTGTFITRLIQSGLINKADLQRKYRNEIYANEIVLLAYYIAAVNIENAYHDAISQEATHKVSATNILVEEDTKQYEPFEGICLTDTFQLGETGAGVKLFSEMFPQNSERVNKQKKAPLRVIIGNPPYSVGQKSANDNAQNQEYIELDKRIAETYAKLSAANLSKSNYDAYIKAFRWSTDRIKSEDGGIIAFITNVGWLDKPSLDGFRKQLENEFSSIYVLNLRGSIRGRSGDNARKEGQNVFDILTGVAITILVKKPNINSATIKYHDIGDYLTRKEKIKILKDFNSISNPKIEWRTLSPNDKGDWLNKRSDIFESFIPLFPEKKSTFINNAFVSAHGPGVSSGRDAWVYNFSRQNVKINISRTIIKYNEEREKYATESINNKNLLVEDLINLDPKFISWSDNLKKDIKRNKEHYFNESNIRLGCYRPFCKQRLYFDGSFIERPGINRNLFPLPISINRVIVIPGIGGRTDFSVHIVDQIVNYDYLEKTQCFPLYYYEERKELSLSLFDQNNESNKEYIRRDTITDFVLQRARKAYGSKVDKEDIFYFVYGMLHDVQYRTKFASDFKKILPRIPLVDEPKDFWLFSKAGRKLAELHLNYEAIQPASEVIVAGEEQNHFTVEKMRFPSKTDKSQIFYNSKITIKNIPEKAYQYVVNGKSAIEWIMERYAITTHKESGIKNDPNDWAIEHNKPRYILDLLLSIINVSVHTVDIVNSLPDVKFADVTTDFGDEILKDIAENIKENELVGQSIKNTMLESLHSGIYSISDVSRILQLDRQKINRWFNELSKENYEGISSDRTGEKRVSFHGLIELAVIGSLRENFSLKKILVAREDLKKFSGKQMYPFATNNLDKCMQINGSVLTFIFPDGTPVTMNGSGQYNLSFVQEFFRRIEFDGAGIAQRLFPLKDSKQVVVDPRLSTGSIVITDKGVDVETIQNLYKTENDYIWIQEQYNLSKSEIEDALKVVLS